jgi:hypothetical protein
MTINSLHFNTLLTTLENYGNVFLRPADVHHKCFVNCTASRREITGVSCQIKYFPCFKTVCKNKQPIPVAARSKAWVCGRSPAEIVVSNPAGGMDVCCQYCVLSGGGLCDGLITRPEESCSLWYV